MHDNLLNIKFDNDKNNIDEIIEYELSNYLLCHLNKKIEDVELVLVKREV